MKILIIAPRYEYGRGPPNALYFLKYIEGFKLLLYTINDANNLIKIKRILGARAITVNDKKNHYVMQLLVKHITEQLKPEHIISIAPELMTQLDERMLERSLVIPQGFYEPIHFKFEPRDITVLTTYPEIFYVSRHIGGYAAISKYMYQRIRDLLRPKKIALIYNPVKEQFFRLGEKRVHRLKNPSKPILLYVGRLVKLKGISKLIQWFPNLMREFGDVELHIVGRGPLLSYIYHIIHKLNLSKIFVYGYVNDKALYSLYEHSNILVTASYWESFCLPVAEAAALAMPSVVREAYALKEHVELGYAVGFKENSAEAFTKAIERAINSYDKLAWTAYDISRKLFYPSKVAYRVLRILENLHD